MTQEKLDYSKIKTLVFEGGSLKGLAYAGALEVITQDYYHHQADSGKTFLDTIANVGGASAGAITALLIAMGLNIQVIKHILSTTAFSTFADKSSWRLMQVKSFAQYGYLCEGDVFYQWVRGLLATYLGNADMTFAELSATSKKHLYVYAVRLNDAAIVEFSANKTPAMSVALAVRMSMSIPVFFKPVRVRDIYEGDVFIKSELDEAGNTYYVDGGVRANYPYALMKHSLESTHEAMLGFRVDSDVERLQTQPASRFDEYTRQRQTIDSGYSLSLIPHILTAMMSGQDYAHWEDKAQLDRTIHCSDCQVSTFDFNLDDEKIDKLLAAGSNAAMQYIANFGDAVDPNRYLPVTQQDREADCLLLGRYDAQESQRVSELSLALKRRIDSTPDEVVDPADLVSLQHDLKRLRQSVTAVKSSVESDVVPLIGRDAIVNARVKVRQQYVGAKLVGYTPAEITQLLSNDAVVAQMNRELEMAASKISQQVIGAGAVILQAVDVDQRAQACEWTNQQLSVSEEKIDEALRQLSAVMAMPAISEAFHRKIDELQGEQKQYHVKLSHPSRDEVCIVFDTHRDDLTIKAMKTDVAGLAALLHEEVKRIDATVVIESRGNDTIAITGEDAMKVSKWLASSSLRDEKSLRDVYRWLNTDTPGEAPNVCAIQ